VEGTIETLFHHGKPRNESFSCDYGKGLTDLFPPGKLLMDCHLYGVVICRTVILSVAKDLCILLALPEALDKPRPTLTAPSPANAPLLKHAPAMLIALKLIEAGASRSQQHHIAATAIHSRADRVLQRFRVLDFGRP